MSAKLEALKKAAETDKLIAEYYDFKTDAPPASSATPETSATQPRPVGKRGGFIQKKADSDYNICIKALKCLLNAFKKPFNGL